MTKTFSSKPEAQAFANTLTLDGDGLPPAGAIESITFASLVEHGAIVGRDVASVERMKQWAAKQPPVAVGADDKATWIAVDLDSLSPEAKQAYADCKEAQRMAGQLRETFEKIAASGTKLPAGRKMIFGYRFGRLSVAIVADDAKPKSNGKAQSLADILAGAK